MINGDPEIYEARLAELKSYRIAPPLGEKCKCGNIAEIYDEMLEDDYCNECWEEAYIEKWERSWLA